MFDCYIKKPIIYRQKLYKEKIFLKQDFGIINNAQVCVLQILNHRQDLNCFNSPYQRVPIKIKLSFSW